MLSLVSDLLISPAVPLTACATVTLMLVGAAQTGLQVAARFKQMNIPTLVIERAARVGDVWRQRYPTLTLHTSRKHHTCKSQLLV